MRTAPKAPVVKHVAQLKKHGVLVLTIFLSVAAPQNIKLRKAVGIVARTFIRSLFIIYNLKNAIKNRHLELNYI